MTMFRRLVAPITFLTVLASLAALEPEVSERFGIAPFNDQGRNVLWVASYLGIAWLLSRVADLVLSRMKPRNRPMPKLLRDMISALLFLVAIVSGTMLLMGHSASGAL